MSMSSTYLMYLCTTEYEQEILHKTLLSNTNIARSAISGLIGEPIRRPYICDQCERIADEVGVAFS